MRIFIKNMSKNEFYSSFKLNADKNCHISEKSEYFTFIMALISYIEP